MKHLLGIGECMVEMAPTGAGGFKQGFAGDVLNTLWYARAAMPPTWQAEFFTGFGTDPMSNAMRDFIEGAGICCASAPTISGRNSGLYMIHLDGAERSFSYWRETSAARQMMQNPTALWDRVARADIVYLSGITLAILPSDGVALLLENLCDYMKQNAILAFDPNIRPHLWPDPDRMKDTITQGARIADIVLPSFDDEASCFDDTTPEATVRRYQALGATTVVVKNGTGSTVAADRHGVTRHPVPPVDRVVDTTAAGDSFNGAFLADILRGRDVPTAIASAHLCAGRVVQAQGALISNGFETETDRFLEREIPYL